jgi:hypothetical protein
MCEVLRPSHEGLKKCSFLDRTLRQQYLAIWIGFVHCQITILMPIPFGGLDAVTVGEASTGREQGERGKIIYPPLERGATGRTVLFIRRITLGTLRAGPLSGNHSK